MLNKGCGSDPNCEYPKPICRNNHECGCNVDEDCEVNFNALIYFNI